MSTDPGYNDKIDCESLCLVLAMHIHPQDALLSHTLLKERDFRRGAQGMDQADERAHIRHAVQYSYSKPQIASQEQLADMVSLVHIPKHYVFLILKRFKRALNFREKVNL